MNFFDEHLRDTPVMAILRGHGVEGTVELCRRAWDLGLALVEVPVQNEADLAALRAAIDEARTRGRLAGAGTVTSVDIVRRVADAGAAFTVAPGLDAEVLRASEEAGMPHLPGVATATEIQAATAHGATWLKAFPASELGAGWFTAMRGPFPRVHLVGFPRCGRRRRVTRQFVRRRRPIRRPSPAAREAVVRSEHDPRRAHDHLQ
jgi:2-dehydro-3-deoxyphosphogluconate aldolase / (4S)-4-hydroxy-2-oxoglutarate aldolase